MLKAGLHATDAGEPREDRKVAAVNHVNPGAVDPLAGVRIRQASLSCFCRPRAHGHDFGVEVKEYGDGL